MSFIDNISKTVGTVGEVLKKTYGPLAALEEAVMPDTLRYPSDVGNSQRYPHTIEFQTWKPTSVSITDMGVIQAAQDNVFKPLGNTPIGAAFRAGINDAKQAAKAIGGAIGDFAGQLLPDVSEEPYAPTPEVWDTDTMKVNRNQRWNDRMMDFTRRAERSDMITMYMPSPAWQDSLASDYQQASMTAALGKAGMIVENGASILKEWDGWGKEGGQGSWSKAMDMAKGPAGMEVLGSLSGALGMDSGVVTSAGLTAMGYAINPQFEMLYQGTNLREFQFDFVMTPRSEKEAKDIRKIIKLFKYHAAPAYVSGQGRYIIPPSYFDITFKFNGADSDWLPQISTCVLKNIAIDYSGGLETWGAHADGSPIQTKMTLIFGELEMMHKSLIKKGY